MDQIMLNMLAFTIDMNGITDVTAHDLVNYGCWCSFGLKAYQLYAAYMSKIVYAYFKSKF